MLYGPDDKFHNNIRYYYYYYYKCCTDIFWILIFKLDKKISITLKIFTGITAQFFDNIHDDYNLI